MDWQPNLQILIYLGASIQKSCLPILCSYRYNYEFSKRKTNVSCQFGRENRPRLTLPRNRTISKSHTTQSVVNVLTNTSFFSSHNHFTFRHTFPIHRNINSPFVYPIIFIASIFNQNRVTLAASRHFRFDLFFQARANSRRTHWRLKLYFFLDENNLSPSVWVFVWT